VSGRHYSEFDRWFAEEHDGSPVEFAVCEVDTGPADCDHLTLCNMHGGTHSISIPGETHRVLHRFRASSTLEAMARYNELLGFEPYVPDPDWDTERGCWKE